MLRWNTTARLQGGKGLLPLIAVRSHSSLREVMAGNQGRNWGQEAEVVEECCSLVLYNSESPAQVWHHPERVGSSHITHQSREFSHSLTHWPI